MSLCTLVLGKRREQCCYLALYVSSPISCWRGLFDESKVCGKPESLLHAQGSSGVLVINPILVSILPTLCVIAWFLLPQTIILCVNINI